MSDLVVRNARLVDGSSAPAHMGDVEEHDGLIVELTGVLPG
jgi:N-acyl-D-aspartate/D-glutamate deacylase